MWGLVKKREGYWSLLIESISLVTRAARIDKLCFTYLALREFCASFDQIVVGCGFIALFHIF